jgi:hypothetical protein
MFPLKSDKIIGYYGFPRRSLLRDVRGKYGFDMELVDLDLNRGAPDSGLVPATTCRIIQNIVDNAVQLGDRLASVVAAVGEDKCDRGRHAAYILSKMGIEVVESRFPPEEFENRPLAYSTGKMPLAERIDLVMKSVVDPAPALNPPERCVPSHGFWGVPPNDASILALFPETTHIYGWTRCVEAGRPGDMELECFIDEGVPTVFFTQSFCSKQDLAHYLAERCNGLLVDCHREVNDSILAKVEAFIRLS